MGALEHVNHNYTDPLLLSSVATYYFLETRVLQGKHTVMVLLTAV